MQHTLLYQYNSRTHLYYYIYVLICSKRLVQQRWMQLRS